MCIYIFLFRLTLSFFCIFTLSTNIKEVLLNTLPQDTSSRLNFGKTLIGLNNDEKNNGIMCLFDDGSKEGPFDLVIGCDGINSAVKEYVDHGSISTSDSEKRSSAIYSGIRVQYAVQDGSDETETDTSELVQYFGDGAYALAGVYGAGEERQPTKGVFLISRDEGYIGPFKRRVDDNSEEVKNDDKAKANENADWSQDVQSLESEMSTCIKDRKVPSIQVGPIVDQADRFFELGVYFHNPFRGVEVGLSL